MTTVSPTEGQCNICLEEYTEENNTCIETLCCKKPFHKVCIEKWTGTCPICRGIWKEGLQPRAPVVTYREDFTDSDDISPAVRFFGGVVTSRVTQRTTIRRPPVAASVVTYYPTIPPTYRETTWTTTYRTAYTNPYQERQVVDRPLGLGRLFNNN